MQTQSTNVAASHMKISPLRRATLILRQQGFWSLWRGNLANVIRYFPNQSLSLAVKDRLREIFLGSDVGKDKGLSRMFWGSLAAGGISGGVCLAGTYPLDLIRTIQAGDASNTSFSTSSSAPANLGILQSLRMVYGKGYENASRYVSGELNSMRSTIKRHLGGVAALYRGFSVSLVLVIVYRGLHFGGYDIAKDLYKRSYGDNYVASHPILNFGFAWIWSLIVGSACYPFDTMRRRLMCDIRDSKGNLVYRGAFDCFRKMVREEGIGSLYRGVGVNVLRSIGSAITLVSYDKLKDLYT